MNQTLPPAGDPDPKILMIKLGAVGDLVMASDFLKACGRTFPDPGFPFWFRTGFFIRS